MFHTAFAFCGVSRCKMSIWQCLAWNDKLNQVHKDNFLLFCFFRCGIWRKTSSWTTMKNMCFISSKTLFFIYCVLFLTQMKAAGIEEVSGSFLHPWSTSRCCCSMYWLILSLGAAEFIESQLSYEIVQVRSRINGLKSMCAFVSPHKPRMNVLSLCWYAHQLLLLLLLCVLERIQRWRM